MNKVDLNENPQGKISITFVVVLSSPLLKKSPVGF